VTLRFRLAPVLDLRRRRTEALEQEHAALQRQRAARLAAIDAIRAEMAALLAALQARQAGGRLDLRAIAHLHAYHERLVRRLAGEELALAELAGRCEAKRAELVAAHQDQKAIEKLKEREEARLAAAARTQELRAVDEIATVRFNLRRRGLQEGGIER
jgi:flagellar export protein FliJ